MPHNNPAHLPKVNVRFYATLRTKAGSDGFPCEAAAVRDALHEVESRFGPNIMKTVNSCSIFVNADNVAQKRGVATRLHDGDVVHIFPPLGGG